MYRKRRKFPVCLLHRTTSSLSVRSLRFAVVMRADEDSRTGRFNFLRSPHLYHSPFRSPSLARCLIVLSLGWQFSFTDLNDIPSLLLRFFLSQVIFRTECLVSIKIEHYSFYYRKVVIITLFSTRDCCRDYYRRFSLIRHAFLKLFPVTVNKQLELHINVEIQIINLTFGKTDDPGIWNRHLIANFIGFPSKSYTVLRRTSSRFLTSRFFCHIKTSRRYVHSQMTYSINGLVCFPAPLFPRWMATGMVTEDVARWDITRRRKKKSKFR